MALTLVHAMGGTFSKCILSMTKIMKRDCAWICSKENKKYVWKPVDGLYFILEFTKVYKRQIDLALQLVPS